MEKNKSRNLLLVIFLLGIFIGALDTGIVSPARTVIADGFKISDTASIWIVTIYTLTYAVSMPIAGKISDRLGKKKIFTISILIFGIGSLLCGLSSFTDNYGLFLGARVIQAIGGGGIMPIATAYIGESFPIEKRGSALGLVGAMYGIATTLGPTVGSFILDTFGDKDWGFLFFINIPICIFVIIVSLIVKDEGILHPSKKMDILGSVLASLTILSLMYGITNLKFHDFFNSLKSVDVYPYLIAFIIILPLFIMVEKKAEDPIINLKYFTDRQIAITLLLSFLVGCGMMGTVFVPQFGENVLRLKVGSGGYLVTLMAIFSGIAAPIGGKFIDKFSAKALLLLGFSSTILGSLILALYTTSHPGMASLIIGLLFCGLGMGFTMGTPLNYLMQSYVDPSEAGSAQSTLSLIRSLGVAVSPNILVNFISDAAQKMPSKIQAVMPKLDIPGMAQNSANSMFSGSSGAEMAKAFQNADVNTIFDVIKNFSHSMMDKMTPILKQNFSNSQLPPGTTPDMMVNKIQSNYFNSLDGAKAAIENTFQHVLNMGFRNLFLCAAIIALIALIFTLFLSNKTKKIIK